MERSLYLITILLFCLNSVSSQSIDSILYKNLSPLKTVGAKVKVDHIFYFGGESFEENTTLNTIAKFLLRNQHIEIQLEVHTDLRGNKEYNNKLSQRTAEFLCSKLIGLGIDKNRITHKGLGETQPLIDCEKFDCNDFHHRLNRRIELLNISKQTESKTIVNNGNVLAKGLYFSIDQDVCNSKKYWECYKSYLENTFHQSYLSFNLPSTQAIICSRIFYLDKSFLILGNQSSFKYSDSIEIEKISQEKIIFKKNQKYSGDKSSLFRSNEIDKLLKHDIEQIIKTQNEGFYRFNSNIINLGIMTKDEILDNLENLDLKEIANNEIYLSLSKKNKRKVGKLILKKLKN